VTRDFSPGNYRFIPAVFQYSSGACALPGFEIERVRFDRPAAFTEAGFLAFNQHYVKTLSEWGIFDGATNPVARSNVCPEIDPPDAPSFFAFSFVRRIEGQRRPATPDFVIAGGAEARGGAGSYPERIVRYRDLSPEGWKEKVGFTVREMESRLAAFGFVWGDTTAAQAYTVHDFHPVMMEELVSRGAARSGLTWHFARPPVVDLEFEMDCRRVSREMVISE
jgi:hypothetical protein